MTSEFMGLTVTDPGRLLFDVALVVLAIVAWSRFWRR